MSADVVAGSTRPRPLSGGFWNLLSWLRGEDQTSSSESISSVGSDHTTISFAFLAPAHYPSGAVPILLPPPGPPTDTYKKRVRERNLRRYNDRDTTLRRKYGLFRGDAASFDGHSLPPARRTGSITYREDRDRRAASECLQRRAAYVPGKRRAPQPPISTYLSVQTEPSCALNSINRRHSRKRRAPLPPNQTLENCKENVRLNSCKDSSKMNPRAAEVKKVSPNIKANYESQNNITKESNLKDSKLKPERSFLKSIFENRKRNSAIDTSPMKLLPNITELDKQAAEIIESSKSKNTNCTKGLKASPIEGDFFCINCLKRYKSIDTCPLCKTKNTVFPSKVQNKAKKFNHIETQANLANKKTSNIGTDFEKQKLREMLKEMKDSLPKRTKLQDSNIKTECATNLVYLEPSSKLNEKEIMPIEAPTLKIGSRIANERGIPNRPSLSNKSAQTCQVKKTVEAPHITKISNDKKMQPSRLLNQECNTKSEEKVKTNESVNNPLKISSLLNPIYIPKNTLQKELLTNSPPLQIKEEIKTETKKESPLYMKTSDVVREILSSPNSKTKMPSALKPIKKPRNDEKDKGEKILSNEASTQHGDDSNTGIEFISQHSKRRQLVNTLEKSISNGDERAAAEAAMKLAQLRLSCSVLSFSSQIMNQPSTSSASFLTTNDNSNLISKKADQSKDNVKNNKASEIVAVKQKQELSKLTPIRETNSNIEPTALNVHKKDLKSNAKNTNITEIPSQDAAGPSSLKTLNPINQEQPNLLPINVWIEDKDKARGPIKFLVGHETLVGGLRRQAEVSLGLPAAMQKWIIGRELCTDDHTPIAALAGPNFSLPFYLCLVECDKTMQNQIRNITENVVEITDASKATESNNIETGSEVYKELVKLEQHAIVPNADAFECEICLEHCCRGDGVILRDCVHTFCKLCVAAVIRHCEEPGVPCPATGCPGQLHEREVRALVSPEEYDRWLNRGLAAAENGTRNTFHCRTRDCVGWAFYETGTRRFPCPVCKHTNCVLCKAIHEGETCEQYLAKLQKVAAAGTENKADEGTQSLIQSLIKKGEALQCPECSTVITKKWGCDWVKCSACKTEICWVTRGRRWGTGGRGDTSGGCRCGVDGKRCHPLCGYCH